jgi:hypothetical protein
MTNETSTEATRAAERVAKRNARRARYTAARYAARATAVELNISSGFAHLLVQRDATVELCQAGAYVAAYIFVPDPLD